jgi:hypothetical protein
MFRPTWPSSGVYDAFLLYSWRNLLCCFCCPFLHVVTLCTSSFVFFCCVFSLVFWFLCACFLPACLQACSVEQRQLNVRQWTIYNKAARRRQHNLKTYGKFILWNPWAFPSRILNSTNIQHLTTITAKRKDNKINDEFGTNKYGTKYVINIKILLSAL